MTLKSTHNLKVDLVQLAQDIKNVRHFLDKFEAHINVAIAESDLKEKEYEEAKEI